MSITLDDLAGIIKDEFDNVNKRFDNVNEQIKDLKQGQDNIELKLANVAYRFEMQEVNVKLNKLAERVDVLEKDKK